MIYLYLFGTCFHFIYVFMIIEKDYGTVYYWDLTKGTFTGNPIPTDKSFDMTVKIKLADMVYSDTVTPYTIKWTKSFRNEAELIKYLEEN